MPLAPIVMIAIVGEPCGNLAPAGEKATSIDELGHERDFVVSIVRSFEAI